MRLIPVLDLKGGRVVRGVGGRRAEYRPIVSALVAGSDPEAVARALISTFQPRELYVADLDALAGAEPALATYAAISQLGVDLWIDAGIRIRSDAEPLIASGIAGIVCGLESLHGPAVLRDLLVDLGPDRVLFSLDLQAGRLLGRLENWPESVLECAVEMGIRRMIVLDLSCVGEGRGTGTEELCRTISARYPHLELFAGGGIRGEGDLQRLTECGIAGALVASALHDGRIGSTRRSDVA